MLRLPRPCLSCNRTTDHGTRCRTCETYRDQARNRRRLYRDPLYIRNAATIRATAEVCALCGEGERVGDPWTADHIVPQSQGGGPELENLRAAHRSCNSRRGAR